MWNLIALTASLLSAQQPAAPPQNPAGGAGQAQKAGQDQKAGEAPKAEQEQPQDAPQVTPPQPLYLKPWAFSLGYSDWNLSGNGHKFRQFGTPPRGFFSKEILFAPKPSDKDTGYITLRGLGESDHRYDGRLSLMNGRTQGEVWRWRSEFVEPTPVAIGTSRRTVDEDSVRQFLTRDMSISMRYRMIDQHAIYEPPLDPFHQRTRYWDAILAGKAGNGQIRLGYTDWRYFDRTRVLLDTNVSGWRLGYMWTPNRDVGVEAAYSNMEIKQPGQRNGRVDYVSLTGDAPIGPSTDLGLLFRRDRLKLPVVTTAYAREQRLAQISLGHSWRKWNARISLSERDVERVRTDQSFVDVPQWVTFEGRLDGRLSRNTRLTLRGYTQSVSNVPPMNSVDPRSLYWDSRDFVQLKLQHATQDLTGYFVWTHRNWENGARAASLSLNSFVLGGRWEAAPRLSLYADYTKENWDGSNEITASPSYRNFLPDSHVISAGADWMIDQRAFVTLNLTTFGSNNENPLLLRDGNTNGLFVSINGRYLFPSGNELGLTIAPWTYRDDVRSVMNYDAAIVMLSGKVRF
jgi:hypothetical protein